MLPVCWRNWKLAAPLKVQRKRFLFKKSPNQPKSSFNFCGPQSPCCEAVRGSANRGQTARQSHLINSFSILFYFHIWQLSKLFYTFQSNSNFFSQISKWKENCPSNLPFIGQESRIIHIARFSRLNVKLDWCGKILKITFKQVGLTLAIIFSEILPV